MFLAAASHDLRQPVHALGLFVGALHRVAMALEGRRMLAQIEASITAMNGLFSALLDVSRLDAGVVTVERRPFAIQSVVDRVSRDFVREAETKGVERILRNLVSNAVRYTERGRIVVGYRRGPRLAEAEASGLLLLHKPVPKGKLRAAIYNLTKSGGR